ncbi:hypothetical protein [Hymenobacter sp. ISL-91]|uniref:hypothetical protein n=1 Tax=Hymenobacter sp. ISL-91 TaxID=2819151 RepID=UPI001BE569C8|nr:hypothetical protein [Hymenobacter sp. ISL-91]
MKSLLRFVLMISLVVIGKLNTTPADSQLTSNDEPLWIIPAHSTSLHKLSSDAETRLLSESGKFRSWQLLRTTSDKNE